MNVIQKSKIISILSTLIFSITVYHICRIPISAHAEISKDNSTTFSINDETYLNLTLSSTNVALSLQPTAAGQFGKTSMTIDVDTNNTTGYNLTMTADTTSLSRSTAVNGINYSIPTLTDSYTCTDETNTACDAFPVGYWGYKLGTDNSTYLPMTTATRSIRLVKEYINSTDTTTLTFGTKLSNSIPTGIYQGVNLTFVAVTNYAPSITYMQEMDQTTADSLVEGFTYTLKDKRDNKNYTITKFSNGDVWMSQNLAITNSVGKNYGTISATDSNFSGNDFTMTSANAFTTSSPLFYDSGSEAKGVYYNFCAAVVANSDGGCGSAEFFYKGDICPSKWAIAERSKFSGINNFLVFPNPFAGRMEGDGIHAGNTFFWSLTAYSWNYIFTPQYGDGWLSLLDGNHSPKTSVGVSIRCIFTGE